MFPASPTTRVGQFLFDGDLIGKGDRRPHAFPRRTCPRQIGRYVLAQRMKNERAEFAWDWHRFHPRVGRRHRRPRPRGNVLRQPATIEW